MPAEFPVGYPPVKLNMKSNAKVDRTFPAFLKEWKEQSRHGRPGRLGRIDQWERKNQANPYRLHPEELSALRHAGFPLTHLDACWIDQYLKLSAYIKKHGHCTMPASMDGSLRSWVRTQRTRRRTGKMSPQRQVALNRLPFFTWEGREMRWGNVWNDGLAELKRFIKQHGHARVTEKFSAFRRTMRFLRHQRNLYRRGRLDPKRQRILEALGVAWAPREERWNHGLGELKRYLKQHGHAKSSWRDPAFCRIGNFLYGQRSLYRQGRLDPKRQRTLEALGVALSPLEEAWNQGFTELKRFVKQHGHANVPHQSPSYGRAANFLFHHRKLYRQGRIDPKRQRILEALGVVWTPKEDRSTRRVAELTRFFKQHGHLKVPYGGSTRGLAQFIETQRQSYRKGRLSPKRQQILEALGISWSPKEDTWNRGFAELKQFAKQYGHLRVPRGNPADRRIGGFLERQRNLYCHGRLDPKRQRALEALGVCWKPRGKH